MPRTIFQSWIGQALAVLLLWLLLCASFPGNRSESDDGYFYALALRDWPFNALFLSKYPLYLPVARLLRQLQEAIAGPVDAYEFLRGLSALAASLSLVQFFRLLRWELGLSVGRSWMGTIALFGCYGFWRYAVEAEVYALAILCALVWTRLALRLANSAAVTVGQWGWLGALGGAIVLVYKPLVLISGLSFALFALRRAVPRRMLAVYAAAAILVVVPCYYACFLMQSSHASFWSYALEGTSRGLGSPLKSWLLLGANVVSPVFVYGLPAASQQIAAWFPFNGIEEEVFLAQNHPTKSMLAAASLLGLTICLLYALVLAWRQRHRISASWRFFAGWVLLYGLAISFLDADGIEPWLLVVPALVALLSLWFQPVQGANGKQPHAVLWAAVSCLFVTNIIGGYLMVKDKEGDYSSAIAAPVLSTATDHDYVLSFGSSNTLGYLRYYSSATIGVPEQAFAACMVAADSVLAAGGRVWLLADFVKPGAALSHRNRNSWDAWQAWHAAHATGIKKHISSRRDFALYEWLPRPH